MAMTHLTTDKFAFLYSGRTEAKYLHNLKEVYLMLTKYCNYPEANVKLAIGGTDPADILHGISFDSVTTVVGFQTLFFNFASLVEAVNTVTDGISNPVNTVLLYFTGSADTSDPNNITYDVLEGTPPTPIARLPFKSTLRGFDSALSIRKNYLLNSYIHFVFDLDSAGGLDTFLTTFDSDHFGSISYSCASGETSEVDVNSSVFTHLWTRAFMMMPLEVAAVDKYADQLTPSGESGTDELVSLLKACEYVKLKWSATPPPSQNPTCTYVGAGPHYLGKPWLVIRDNDPAWQSVDIKLKHPDPANPVNELPDVAEDFIDDYEMDDPSYATIPGYIYKNHIHVWVWNGGTHPVIHAKSDVILYDTGCGGTGWHLPAINNDDLRTAKKILIPVDGTEDFDPIAIISESDIERTDWSYINGIEYNFNQVPFTTPNHRCIRAMVRLGSETDPDVTGSWNISLYEQEAQRNINQGVISKSKSGSGASAGGTGGTGNKTADKELIDTYRTRFVIENPFKGKKRFRVVWPPMPELNEILDIKIYKSGARLLLTKPGYFGKNGFIEVSLDTKQKTEYILEITKKINLHAFERIELPFEIQVAERNPPEIIHNRSMIKIPGWITIGGFTVSLVVTDSNLVVQVKDEKGLPAPKAQVRLTTADGFRTAVLTTDKDGILRLNGINPANYRIEVLGKTGKPVLSSSADLRKTNDRLMRLIVSRRKI